MLEPALQEPGPVVLGALPRIGINDLLLTSEEFNLLIRNPNLGLPESFQFPDLKQSISNTKRTRAVEVALLNAFSSNRILEYMCRCFGPKHVIKDPRIIGVLRSAYHNEKTREPDFILSEDDRIGFEFLIKCGVINIDCEGYIILSFRLF
jgi:hypothetical protein